MSHEWRYSFDLALTPPHRKRESASQLVLKMSEEHAVDRLMTYTFAGLADEVEDALSFKARNADPRVRPFYSRILYTWYIQRGDYRNGASTSRMPLQSFNLQPELQPL